MSKRPFECFKCRDNGYPNTMVYLAGKDDQGRTIQLEESGEKHIHKIKGEQEISLPLSSTSVQSIIEQIHNLLASMDGKLDRLVDMIEKKQQLE